MAHAPSIRPPGEPLKIVLTGAPGSGKSTAVARLGLAEAFADWRARLGGVTVVREAATQVYSSRKQRWDELDLEQQRDAQRAIYNLQMAQESEAAAAAKVAGHRVILLDRGSVDGAAYWPDGPAAYWQDLQTSAAVEIARYDAILLLESGAAIGIYDGKDSNDTRFEDAKAALENATKLAGLWSAHPHRREVAAESAFDRKLAHIAAVIEQFVSGK